jgi:nitroreductase
MATATQGVTDRMRTGTAHLITHLADAPVLIFICGTNGFPSAAPREEMMLSAVHGAAQNLIVAARALELGAAYTTFHTSCETELKELLGIPEAPRICVTIPVGWPTRKFVQLKRRPLEEVVRYDHW